MLLAPAVTGQAARLLMASTTATSSSRSARMAWSSGEGLRTALRSALPSAATPESERNVRMYISSTVTANRLIASRPKW